MSDSEKATEDVGKLSRDPHSIHESQHAGAVTEEVVLPDGVAAEPKDEPFLIRLGLSPKSFHKRHYGRGIVELDRRMEKRHLNMIAIGGSIGAGFFVGSGSALNSGGPGFILIDFLIIGVMMFNVVYALGELSVMYPVSGGFYTYSSRFIDPTWGFAMGWNYVMQWASVLPLELTVCSMTVAYWNDDITHAAWITIFLVAIIVINIFGTIGYAEEEFWASCIKLLATIIFMIIAFILVLGGGPSSGRYDEYWGARLWYDPGAFRNGFRGFCSVFVTAAFSFSGTELVGLAAAESENPLKSLPSAVKQVFWRISLFYILGLFFVGLLISSDDTNLLGANPYADTNASPFVLVGKYADLKGFDSFMNAVILISVLSIGTAAVFGGSRTLTALAQQGYAPKIFTYIDRSGRPLVSVTFHIACGLLAYVSLASAGSTVFDWLQALSGLAVLFTWGSICLAHIRFRAAWKYHGHTLDEIPFKAAFGVCGSYLGLALNILVLLAQLYVAICPVGGGFNDASGFFTSFLAFPLVVVFWIGGYIWKRRGWMHLRDIDVDSGRRVLNWDEINAHRAQLAQLGFFKRMLHKLVL